MSCQFYVEANYWARWPKVLVMCKKTGNGVERRRYIPEGGTRDQWNERMREIMRNYSEGANKLNARLLEESELPNLQAEIDGLKWAVEERDALVRDMYDVAASGEFDVGEEAKFSERMAKLGIGTCELNPKNRRHYSHIQDSL